MGYFITFKLKMDIGVWNSCLNIEVSADNGKVREMARFTLS